MAGNKQSTTSTYNADGIRTSKTVNGVTTEYTLDGSNVVVETNGTDTIWYYYDASGSLTGFELNGTPYFYVKNAQGDIIAITNASGTKVVEYVYDSWGKLISTTGSLASTVGAKNPYRYRGYRYDVETGLYYLQSRYYDPVVKRFINADTVVALGIEQNSLIQFNMYTYCQNNPIMNSDPSGYFSWKDLGTALLITAAACATVAVVAVAIVYAAPVLATTIGVTMTSTSVASLTAFSTAAATASFGLTISGGLSYGIDAKLSKGGRQNQRDSGLRDVPDEEIDRRYKDPSTSPAEKQRLKKEQKARGNRNKSKRSNGNHSRIMMEW